MHTNIHTHTETFVLCRLLLEKINLNNMFWSLIISNYNCHGHYGDIRQRKCVVFQSLLEHSLLYLGPGSSRVVLWVAALLHTVCASVGKAGSHCHYSVLSLPGKSFRLVLWDRNWFEPLFPKLYHIILLWGTDWEWGITANGSGQSRSTYAPSEGWVFIWLNGLFNRLIIAGSWAY